MHLYILLNMVEEVRMKVREHVMKDRTTVYSIYLPKLLYKILDSPDEFKVEAIDTKEKTITLRAVKKFGGESM